MGAACGVHADPLTVQPRRLHFGFVTQVPVFVKEKNDPVDAERQRKVHHGKQVEEIPGSCFDEMNKKSCRLDNNLW